jgi:hypothetical protein
MKELEDKGKPIILLLPDVPPNIRELMQSDKEDLARMLSIRP